VPVGISAAFVGLRLIALRGALRRPRRRQGAGRAARDRRADGGGPPPASASKT
jgi:hypothetical protein